MKEKTDLSSRAKMIEAKKDQTIFLPSDVSNSLYFLKVGKVKRSPFSDEGKEMIFTILSSG